MGDGTMPGDSKKKREVEAVARTKTSAATEPEARAGSCSSAPALHLHQEIVDFLANLIVEEQEDAVEVRP